MKEKFSKEAKNIITKNIERGVHNIAENTILEEKSKIYNDRMFQNKLGRFIYLVGIAGPLLAIFQATKIFLNQTAIGVSVLYWGAYLVVAGAWFGYGIYYKNKAITFVYGSWIIIEIIILNGIYLYG